MSSYLYILYFCAVFGAGVSSRKHHHIKKSDGKIVGGTNATIENYAYQAHLILQQGTDNYLCGGSIISDRKILTAAHCLTGVQKALIRIGSSDSNSGGYEYESSMFFIHPSYNARKNDYDVAVISVPRRMTLDGNTTKTVPLPSQDADIPPGTEVVVTGWGATSEDGSISENLMSVTVPTISNDECSKRINGITERMFCAGVPEGGKDSCQGDSGGPAVQVADGIQIGIVSFGVGCARPDLAGVYTRIAAVRDWIKLVSGV